MTSPHLNPHLPSEISLFHASVCRFILLTSLFCSLDMSWLEEYYYQWGRCLYSHPTTCLAQKIREAPGLVTKISIQDIWCKDKYKPHLDIITIFPLKFFKNPIPPVYYISANVRRAKLAIFTLPISQRETKTFFICKIIPKFSQDWNFVFVCFLNSSSVLPIGGKIKKLEEETSCHWIGDKLRMRDGNHK